MSGVAARFRLGLGGFALDVDLALPGRGVTAVCGPSGAGKTTLLRCAAGLERAPEGRFEVNGTVWQDEANGRFLPPHRRALGYVFQEAALFSHLSVAGNLDYGLRRTPPARRRVERERAVEMLGLGSLLDRRPERLSGGERQRVAVARALLRSPDLLLMDEPLASLDLASRGEILPYLERLHRELAVPVLYVSHTPAEVARLADHLVLLAGGRVRAAGPYVETVARLDLLDFTPGEEVGVVAEAVVAGHDAEFDLTYLDFSGGRLSLPRQVAVPGERLRVRVLARDVSLALVHPGETSILNVFPARIVELAPDRPGEVMVRLDVGGTALLARVTRKSEALLGLRSGLDLFAAVKSAALLS